MSGATFSGGIIGTQSFLPYYSSGAFSFEVAGGETAMVEFDEPVASVRMFLVHRSGYPGTVRVFGASGLLDTVASQVATTFADPTRFVDIEPGEPITRLELEATGSPTMNLFVDDMQWERAVDHVSRISEFALTGNPNIADPASERVLLEFEQPQFNHNAGQLSFRRIPDEGSYLYISTGDGGGADDNDTGHTGGNATKPSGGLGNARDKTKLLGKVLRIDVDGTNGSGGQYGIPLDNPFIGAGGGVREEIYAYGLRNPWRFSFDDNVGGTGRLFLADVGQGDAEEVSIITSGGNFGWRQLEGPLVFDATTPAAAEPPIAPIAAYSRLGQPNSLPKVGIAVVGGHVYRGPGFPALTGKYLFGDWSTTFTSPGNGTVLGLDETSPGTYVFEVVVIDGTTNPIGEFITAFGADEAGEIYMMTRASLAASPGPSGPSGTILKVVPPIVGTTTTSPPVTTAPPVTTVPPMTTAPPVTTLPPVLPLDCIFPADTNLVKGISFREVLDFALAFQAGGLNAPSTDFVQKAIELWQRRIDGGYRLNGSPEIPGSWNSSQPKDGCG